MAGTNVNATGNYNNPIPPSAADTTKRVVRVVIEAIDPSNEDLYQGLRFAAQFASEAIIAETSNDAAAHDAAEAAQHAFVASSVVTRVLFAVGADKFVYGSRGRREQPLWGPSLRAATRAAFTILAGDPSRSPMTTAEAACAAAGEVQRGSLPLVLVEPVTQAAVAGARAAVAALRRGAQRLEVSP